MTRRHLEERDQRWARMNQAMRDDDLDAVIFAANDYRGHKGSLRWISDYNLPHKWGHAIMFRDQEPILVLSGSLSAHRRPETKWVSDLRFPGILAEGMADVLGERPVARVGIIGMGQVLKVDEYLSLTSRYPDVEFLDYSAQFDAIRAVKSPLEIQGAAESAHILDGCFSRLLEITQPGMTERQVAAEMHRTGHALGGEDPIFLTMHTEYYDEVTHATFGIPRNRVLEPHSLFTFSFEMVGPLGYWTELARMVTFAKPTDDDARMARAVTRGIKKGSEKMVPGAFPSDVQKNVIEALEAENVKPAYWSGHSIGQDVIENPWIGLDVVEDGSQSIEMKLQENYVMALHPQVIDAEAGTSGYMSDTFVVTNSGPTKLSRHATGLYTIANGNVEVDTF